MSEKGKYSQLFAQMSPETLAQPAELGEKTQRLYIGIPKVLDASDFRVPLSPAGVSLLINQGHEVVIERSAGDGANFSDHDYSEAGAEICDDPKKVFEADILLMVSPPTGKQMDMLKHGQTIISPLHLPTVTDEHIRKLMSKKLTCFAFEYIKDESGNFPFVRAMSEIAGNCVVTAAAELMTNSNGGRGVMLGGVTGVPPAKVVILGAGVVGECAAKAALGMGASVKVFDNNIHKLLRLQNNLGQRIFTSVVDPVVLKYELKMADLAIGAIHSEAGRSPVVISEQMVSQMKEGAVIVDVSIDQGGCFETSELTTHNNPTVIKHGVIHYGVPNIASRVSRTASYAISNILTATMLRSADTGGLDGLIRSSEGARNGVYIYKGVLTNEHLSELFTIKHTSIDLLIASSL